MNGGGGECGCCGYRLWKLTYIWYLTVRSGEHVVVVMNCTCCYQRGVVVAKGWLNADGSTVVQTPNNTQKKED